MLQKDRNMNKNKKNNIWAKCKVQQRDRNYLKKIGLKTINEIKIEIVFHEQTQAAENICECKDRSFEIIQSEDIKKEHKRVK